VQVYTAVLILKPRCTNTAVNYTYCMTKTVVCSSGLCLFVWAWPMPTIPTSLGYKQSCEGKHARQLMWCTPRGMILCARWWGGRGRLLGRCSNWWWSWCHAPASVTTTTLSLSLSLSLSMANSPFHGGAHHCGVGREGSCLVGVGMW
jgi:hypothetical protein